MNQIYKQKAEKYKYKYLKLKQDLYGGEDIKCIYSLPITFEDNSLDFGSDKPGDYDKPGKLKIVTNYPDGSPNIDFNKFNISGNTGRIFKYEDYQEILPLLKNSAQYTKLEYTCTINKEIRTSKIILGFNSKWLKKNHIKNKFTNCPIFNKSKDYGYIITKNIDGFNLKELIDDINNFIKFLNDLISTIQNVIKPLYEGGYILNIDYNIDYNDIEWDKKKEKVYLNILNITKNTKNYKDIKNLTSCIYKLFNNIQNSGKYYYTEKLLKKLNDDKNITIDNLIKNLPYINECIKYEDKLLILENDITVEGIKLLNTKNPNTKVLLSNNEINLIKSNIEFFEYNKKIYDDKIEQLFKNCLYSIND